MTMKQQVKKELREAGIRFHVKSLSAGGELLTIISLKNTKIDNILKVLEARYKKEQWNYTYDFDKLEYRMTVPAGIKAKYGFADKCEEGGMSLNYENPCEPCEYYIPGEGCTADEEMSGLEMNKADHGELITIKEEPDDAATGE